MVITYYGAMCFKAQAGENVIAFAPPSKNSKFKSPRFQADIVLLPSNHPDCNGWENLSSKDGGKPPFVADGAGEYEVNGIYIKGVSSPAIYVVNFEDIILCHLGFFDSQKLTPEIKEQIGKVDILFVSIPEDDGQKAADIISQIEPKIAIPMNYKDADLRQFLREFGESGVKPEEKLTIKKKDLSEEKTRIAILSPAI
jgi:L-ascorbate metabolism protein UlaG (beta-lactamase superfamily)